MPLQKINEFDPNYVEAFEGKDIKGRSVYAQETKEKIGTVKDILVDEHGQFRYLVVELGLWVFGKQVLLPAGRARIDSQSDRITTIGLTKQHVEALPEYNERTTLDYEQEEQVRGVYRSQGAAATGATTGATAAQPSTPAYNRDTYSYDQDQSLYDLNNSDTQNIKLYQERLLTSKTRAKTGDVTIGKHVKTETERVSVPVDKERVVIERVTPTDAGRAVTPGEANFREGQVAHMDIYEEIPEIHKEAVVREEVKVNKVVDRETAQAEETVRREELDIDSEDKTIEDKPKTGRSLKNRI